MNTSFLHLYYLVKISKKQLLLFPVFQFNQQSTIRLRYDLITNVRSSNVFIKLSELIRNSEGIIDNVKTKKRSTGATPQFASPQPVTSQLTISMAPKRLPNFRMANEKNDADIVDKERKRFEQQLVDLRQKPKNQQKTIKASEGPPKKQVSLSKSN